MKKTLKGYILGILSAAILMSCVAYAANTTTLYNVLAQGIKIVVDGKLLHPTDAGGNTVEPIIYNGTTYLPVRAVANALGKAVYWDGPNYTVYLGDMNGKLQYPTVRIENMTSIAEKPALATSLTDNYGNRYSSAIWNRAGCCNMEFLLNMRYSRFKGTLYIPHGDDQNGTNYVQVIADGNIIYTSPEMTRASYPIDFDIDIRGYNNVQVKIAKDHYGSTDIHIGDAGFYQ